MSTKPIPVGPTGPHADPASDPVKRAAAWAVVRKYAHFANHTDQDMLDAEWCLHPDSKCDQEKEQDCPRHPLSNYLSQLRSEIDTIVDAALAASDALLRTDAAVERVARAIYLRTPFAIEVSRDLARAAIDALLDGEA